MRHLSTGEGTCIIEALEALPEKIERLLGTSDQIKAVAQKYVAATGLLFFGRQLNFPIALEAALKVKEVTYLYAEGHPSAELKHGIIALVRPELPSIFIAPDDAVFSKNLHNIDQVRARSGRIVAVTTESGAEKLRDIVNDAIVVPDADEIVMPVLTVIPL